MADCEFVKDGQLHDYADMYFVELRVLSPKWYHRCYLCRRCVGRFDVFIKAKTKVLGSYPHKINMI